MFLICFNEFIFVFLNYEFLAVLALKKILKNTDWGENDVIMTSSRRHNGVYPIEIN